MRFTIVTPVMNGIRWLAECVASVDAQRADVEVEHIVLDPGSTDGTREWLRTNAPHATLVFEPDGGQTDALARGFARATGDVLGWLNADDVLEAGALARVRDAFAPSTSARPHEARPVAVSGGCLVIDETSRLVRPVPLVRDASLPGLLRDPVNLAQPSTFFRADAYRKVGGLDTSVSLAMDVALWLQLARAGRIVILDGPPLSRFRIHAGARSVTGAARTAREDLALRRRAGMPLLSRAGLTLVRYGYVQPLLAPLWRRLPARVRATLRPERA